MFAECFIIVVNECFCNYYIKYLILISQSCSAVEQHEMVLFHYIKELNFFNLVNQGVGCK